MSGRNSIQSVIFLLEEEGPAAAAARRAAAGLGPESRVILASRAGGSGAAGSLLPPFSARERRGLLVCADSARLMEEARRAGFYFCGLVHGGNGGADLSAADYLIADPDEVDADSYEKIRQRAAGLPWRIAETERCTVRELGPGDAEAVRALYDAEALRFLEPPEADIAEEREVLAAYARRVYGFYGYGVWGAFLKTDGAPADTPDCGADPGADLGTDSGADPDAAPGARAAAGEGPLIARAGFEPLKHGEEVPSFGYLVHPDYRRQGFAREICSALLAYGRDMAGFSRICARTREDNAASVALLASLGFAPAPDPAPREGYLYALWPADGVQ